MAAPPPENQDGKSGTSSKAGSRRNHRTPGSYSGTNLSLAGGHNQRVTLQAIRVNSPITRVDLAAMTGLTSPAIANITKKLLAEGLIAEVGRVRGGRGQPAKMLAINPDGCFSIGVNIDRDHITMVVLDLLGRVRAHATSEVDFALPAAVAKFCENEIEFFFNKIGIPRDKVIGIGVAIPDDLGKIDLPRRPAGYAAWNDTDIEGLFSKILPVPVYVENDAAAAANGEMQFGAGLNRPSFFYILVSWGLGGGLVIDGAYYRGATGRSGEIGFLPVRTKGGGTKMLQEVFSLSALHRCLTENGLEIASIKRLEDIPANRVEVVEEWIDLSVRRLVEPLTAINCLINPNGVLIGGRLPPFVADAVVRKLNEALAKRAKEMPSLCPVETGAIAEDAPAVGAAILPFSDMLLPTRSALFKVTT